MERLIEGISICKHTQDLQGGMWFLCEDARFLQQALEKNPAGVITTKEIAKELSCPCIIVQSTWQTWSDFCFMKFPKQPKFIAGITGTSGKTSTAYTAFLLFQRLGLKAAYIGTNGVYSNIQTPFNSNQGGVRTTPDAFELHKMLDYFAENGITHVAMEVSSSGLQRKRVANVRLDVAVWTSFGREHLEIHGDLEEYWNTKMDILNLIKKGGKFIISKELEDRMHGIDYQIYNAEYRYKNPNYNFFMQDNLQAACRICELAGFTSEKIALALSGITEGVPGRMERVASDIVVDFAHNPGALERLLLAFSDHDIVLVFGCGGDRDKGKRRIMGKIAATLAHTVIVTDDNPRTEDPAEIRREVLEGCPNALEIPDRAQAIERGVSIARNKFSGCDSRADFKIVPGKSHFPISVGGEHVERNVIFSDDSDVTTVNRRICIIAGKGCEEGQIYGDKVLPFSDLEIARKFAQSLV